MMNSFANGARAAGWDFIRQKVGLETLLSISLLFWALGAVVVGLGDVVRGLAGIQIALWILIVFGLGLGWWSASRQGGKFLLAFWVVSGSFIVFLLFGGLLLDGWFLLRAILAWGIEWADSFIAEAPMLSSPSHQALHLAWISFAGKAMLYGAEILLWLDGWFVGDPGFNLRALEFFSGVLTWFLAVLAGWIDRKNGHFEWSLVPAGILLLAAQAFARHVSHYSLIMFVTPMLLLFAFRTWRSNENRWNRINMDYAEYLRFDFTVAATIWVLILVFLAYLVPLARDLVSANAWFQSRQAQVAAAGSSGETVPIGDALGLMTPTPTQAYLSTFQSPGMPRSHLLGAGPELSEQVVMFVHLENHPDPAAERFNWRGLVYDLYNGSGWSVGPLEQRVYQAGAEIPLEFAGQERVLRQSVRSVGSVGQLAYAAGDILSMDHPFEVSWAEGPDEPRRIFGVRQRAEQYRVDSVIPTYTPDLLRSRGTGYPPWISGRYLSLPDQVPARVQDLAAQITRDQSTPYDQARAIERYLRGFPYNLDLPAPPADRDVVDYFLFDLQEGYCDYYASAMVVMARSAGIPARLAIGFNAGTYDSANQRYIVTAQQAHSWPEIYFPGVGWVAFEPTAGVAPISWDQVPREIGAVELMGGDSPIQKIIEVLPENGWFWFTVGLSIFLLVVFWIDRLVLRSYAPDRFFALVMQRFYRFQRTALGSSPGQTTPYELVQEIQAAFSPLFKRPGFVAALLDGRAEIDRLTEYHVLSSYSQKGAGKNEKDIGLRLWLKLRYQLLFITIWLIFQRVMRRQKS
jgi:transglutaminase-like putative cysteine protease